MGCDKNMKLVFLGATHEVTGSCFYLEAAGKKFLVDYGMEQGRDTFENEPIPVPASQLDFVLLTHAHIDHSGMLPLLYAAPTFRSLRRNGATVKANAPEKRNTFRSIPWKTPWGSSAASRAFIIRRISRRFPASGSVLSMPGI